MTPPLASLAMIALVRDRTTEKALVRALQSVEPLLAVGIDEARIVLDDRSMALDWQVRDGGRDDGTLSFTRRAWPESFADQRNFADSICRGDWIVLLDADDVYETTGDLRRLMLEAPSDVDAIFGEHRSVDEHGAVVEVTRHAVAYRRGRCSWKWREHSQVLGIRRCIDSTAVIRKTYRKADLPGKARRAIPLLMRDLEDEPKSAHAPFFLARSWWLLGDARQAIAWARRAIDLAPDDRGYATAWVLLAWATLDTEGVPAAGAVVDEAMRWHPTMPDLLHARAFLAAARWMDACQEAESSWRITGISTARFAPRLAEMAMSLGWPIAAEAADA
jgi:tetratricopeptide (TPR) repeat protein